MGVFRDGGESKEHKGSISEDAIRKAIEQSGSVLADKLSKMLAGMPKSQVIRILNGEGIDGVDLDDVESLRRIAKVVSAGGKVKESNFIKLGTEKTVEAEKETDETIKLLEQMGGS